MGRVYRYRGVEERGMEKHITTENTENAENETNGGE
jgi:hypothetical protein